jgi:hypothetical protein
MSIIAIIRASHRGSVFVGVLHVEEYIGGPRSSRGLGRNVVKNRHRIKGIMKKSHCGYAESKKENLSNVNGSKCWLKLRRDLLMTRNSRIQEADPVPAKQSHLWIAGKKCNFVYSTYQYSSN